MVLAVLQRRATFLPQMWKHFGTAAALLDALKEKAGLARDFWSPEVVLWRYTVLRFRDGDAPDED